MLNELLSLTQNLFKANKLKGAYFNIHKNNPAFLTKILFQIEFLLKAKTANTYK